MEKNKEILVLTSRQPSNAGCFRREAFNKPINSKEKANIQQVNPALQLLAGRYGQNILNDWLIFSKFCIFVKKEHECYCHKG
jgi:hypothetical protein